MFYVKDREIVIPGQLLAENERHGENCIKENSKIYSKIFGMVTIGGIVDVIPLNGIYNPKKGDVVIGVVVGIKGDFCFVDINSPYPGIIVPENGENFFNIRRIDYNVGDIISAIVTDVNEVNKAILGRVFKITGGNLIKINPKRVPRVIGKNKSMLNLIREKTKCRIIVGQNGIIWISDGDIKKAVEIINFVADNAYKQGLTEKVAVM